MELGPGGNIGVLLRFPAADGQRPRTADKLRAAVERLPRKPGKLAFRSYRPKPRRSLSIGDLVTPRFRTRRFVVADTLATVRLSRDASGQLTAYVDGVPPSYPPPM